MRRLLLTFQVAAPIITGAAIYTLWRKPTLLVFGWYNLVGLTPVVAHLRAESLFLLPHIPAWVLPSLPDGLWVYAVTAFMTAVWHSAPTSMAKVFWLSVGLLLGAGGELGQLVGLIPGTC